LPKIKSKKNGTGKFIRTVVEKPKSLENIPRYFSRYGLPEKIFRQSLCQIHKPHVVLITSCMTYWYPGVQYAVRLIKEKYPSIPVILGGIYATLCKNHAMETSGADFIIAGPGEKKALELVNSLAKNLDNEPSINFEFPEPSYHYYQRLASVPIITSYGCPYFCSFCASVLLAGKFRQRDPEQVINEIRYYHDKRKVRHFAFLDDALLINHENHISLILDAIIKLHLDANFHTPNGLHPKEIDDSLAQKMFQSNFKTIRLSYETINLSRQKEMGQKVTDDCLIRALMNLEKAGFQRRDLDVYVMMGLPEQPVDEVIESLLFVASLCTKVRLTSFSPIPGTKDWQRSVELYNLPPDVDPLLTNKSIYPLHRDDFTVESFQELRNLSKVINYGLDHDVNYFDQSNLAKHVQKFIKSKQ
jgi:radical SAM superfamily enzyme YgiQ (UPF0313 family)